MSRQHDHSTTARVGLTLVVAALGMLTTACSLAARSSTADADVPTQPQLVEVTMAGQAYALSQDRLRPGRVVFQVANEDDTDHDLTLVKLPDDATAVSQWLDSGVGGVQPVYIMADRGPGEHGVFAVDLPAGQYGVLCFVEDETGTPHYKNGMVADFRVTPAEGDTGAPAEPGGPSPSDG